MSRKDRNSRNQKEKELRIVKEEDFTFEAPKESLPPKQVSFEEWWTGVEFALKLNPMMKEAIKKHFEIRGFMKSGEFDKGIKDFGL